MATDLEGVRTAGWGSGSDPMLPQPFRVVAVRRDTRDTVSMDLLGPDGAGLPFRPGQFTMLSAFGVGEVPISISGDPTRRGPLTHTVRDVGGVTTALAAVQPGDVLGVRGPFGLGWEVPDGEGGDVVFVAGGIGLAPLRPAVLEVVAHRERYGRVSVLIGARTPSDLLFGEERARWADADLDVAVTVDRASTAWHGGVGLVTELITRARFDPTHTIAAVCGPEVMMRHVGHALTGRGLPPGRIRLSLERNMRCGIGLCGHCQLREHLICVDGPVFSLDRVQHLMRVREL